MVELEPPLEAMEWNAWRDCSGAFLRHSSLRPRMAMGIERKISRERAKPVLAAAVAAAVADEVAARCSRGTNVF